MTPLVAPPARAPGTSLAVVLDVLLGDPANAGFAPASRARLFDVARQLPAALTKQLYFERRLVAGHERVDLSVRVDRARRRVLAGDDTHFAVAPRLTNEPMWEHVRALAAAWSAPGSLLDRSIEAVWLEFDLDARAPGTVAPGVFVDFTSAAFTSGTSSDRGALAAVAVQPLLGRPMGRAVRDTLDHAFAALPPTATVPYVGVLSPRGAHAVRLCVDNLDDEGTARYLRAVGWPGGVGEVVETLRALHGMRRGHDAGTDDAPTDDAPTDDVPAAYAPRWSLLHLDVGAAVQPRLSVEFSLGRRSQFRGVVRETAFLRSLVERGFCTPAALDALLAWPGCGYVRMPHELWPSLVVRRLNHVKLVFDGDGPAEAKAYLGASYDYVARPDPPNDAGR